MASPQQPSRPGPQPEADHPGTEGAVPEALCHNCATSDEVVDVPLTVSVIVAGTMADWARGERGETKPDGYGAGRGRRHRPQEPPCLSGSPGR